MRAALDRDGQEVGAKALATALALSHGSVRRALELVSGEGIELYAEIAAALAALPEIDGMRLHRNVERLAGMGDTERLELYLALLLGLIERLIRFTATGEGATPEERSLAKRLISPANLSVWAEAWEAISEARGRRWRSISTAACSCSTPGSSSSRSCGNILFSQTSRHACPCALAPLFLPPWRTNGRITSPLPSPIRTTRRISAMPMRRSRPMRWRASAACTAMTCSF